jgi:hypothetical protein
LTFNKYHVAPRADRTALGVTFASKLEMTRYLELVALERLRVISELRRQVPYPLHVNGKTVCRYVADAVYRTMDGHEVVEDCKGVVTAVYRLKRAMMLAEHGIKIAEVRARPRPGRARRRRRSRRS